MSLKLGGCYFKAKARFRWARMSSFNPQLLYCDSALRAAIHSGYEWGTDDISQFSIILRGWYRYKDTSRSGYAILRETKEKKKAC